MTARPAKKKTPAKAGARLSVDEKREQAAVRKIEIAEFQAQHGEGHNDLENFLLEFEANDFSEANPAAYERLLEHVEMLARAISGYLDHEFRTLDEAFKVRRPEGYRQPAARKRHLHRRKVLVAGRVLKSAGAVVDTAFFEVVGQIAGVKKTQASDWYYEVVLPRYKQITDLPPALEKYRNQLNWKK